jgi:hypothetical protein
MSMSFEGLGYLIICSYHCLCVACRLPMCCTIKSMLPCLKQAVENLACPPFIIVSPADHVESVRNCLIEHDYFGLDTKKVQSIFLLLSSVILVYDP